MLSPAVRVGLFVDGINTAITSTLKPGSQQLVARSPSENGHCLV